jgi:hypothetical protein
MYEKQSEWFAWESRVGMNNDTRMLFQSKSGTSIMASVLANLNLTMDLIANIIYTINILAKWGV